MSLLGSLLYSLGAAPVADDRKADNDYDDPNGSEWVLGVDTRHRVFIIKTPDLNPLFFEGFDAEDIGLPYDLPDLAPGVYLMRMRYVARYYGEYGNDEEWVFEPEAVRKLYVEGLIDELEAP